MDEKLRLIQYLYGEDVDTELFRNRLRDDPALRREYMDLRAMKKQLDDQAPTRPDAAVIDRIVEAAGAAARATPARSSRDRRPVRSRRPVMVRLRWTSAALAVVVMALVSWWTLDQSGTRAGVQALSADGPVATQSAPDATGPNAVRRALPAPSLAFEASPPLEPAAALSWDEGDDVVHLHQHIELLQASSTPTRWGASSAFPARQIRPLGR